MPNYLAELVLTDRTVLMFGGGRVARRKVEGLLESGARVTVVAPTLDPWVAVYCERGELRHEPGVYSPARLDQPPRPLLVFAATDQAEVNLAIAEACRERGILCNSVNDARVSGFYVPAVLRRGVVAVGVCTSGASPALSRLLKERIDDWLEPGWGPFAKLLATMREIVHDRLGEDGEARQRFWRETCLAAVQEKRYLEDDNTDWLLAKLEQALRQKD